MLKKRHAIFLMITMLSMESVMAKCVLDTKPPSGALNRLQHPAFTPRIDADASADLSKSIAVRDFSRRERVSFICDHDDVNGKNISPPFRRIISTPVCQIDGGENVDFNAVSSAGLIKGVSRPLNFVMSCKTDYGSYSATAKLTTPTPTSDNKYIQVADSAGNMDRLKIRIDDSNGSLMHVDGTSSEVIEGHSNSIPAQFKWTATLLKGPAPEMPAMGQFSTSAEIILQLN
ncbi:Fimbrial protein [Izhakiella capsodis]|uniref:Fimbrial protein n=1 Tax=Izhakiella capsodis TaxID=1367852 RepID=A0A1I5A1U1_9GAMM|nr:fimbrial protein [Izhakiella capsodis]SFN56451.1 Fimbrial protein [Izhakiella capsodis]